MPRVLLLNQYYAPDEAATAQMLADLGAGLAAAGCDVTAICCDRSYADPSRRYPARETIDGVDIRRVRTSGFGRGSKLGRITDYLTFLAGATLRLLTAPKPNVVVSLSTPPMVSLLGTILGKLRGARTIFWSMDVYPDVAYELGAIKKGSLVGRLVAFLAHLTHRLPDTVVALGETMKEKLEAGGARNVVVIHNWADGDAIRPMPLEENPLRKTWAWSDRFVILYSGNMGLGHEFETALKGIANFEFRISNLTGEDISNFELRISNLAGKDISDFELRISNLASPAGTIGDNETEGALPVPSPKLEIRNSKFEMPLLAFIGTGPRRAKVEARAVELGLTTPNAAAQSPTTSPINSNSEVPNPKSPLPLPLNSKFEIRNSKSPLPLTSNSNSEIRNSKSSPPLPLNSKFEIRNSKSAVQFHPPLPRADLTHSLTAPDVHLVTMREGMPGLIVPSKIYGILAAGKPTIYVGPAEGEIYDIITSGSCGIHVPIGDTGAFSDALARYAHDPALVAEHGRNARRLFDTRFTRQRGIEEFRKALGGES